MNLDAIDKILHALIYDVAVNAAVAAATAAVPWLGLPIVSTVFRYLVTKIAGQIYTQLDKAVIFKVIDMKTDGEKQEYEQSVQALVQAQKSGDADAIEASKKKFKETLAKLIHFDGGIVPPSLP